MILVLLACGLGAGQAFALEFKGQVLDRENKQPVAKVVVQAFQMNGTGQNIVAAGYTNADGRFHLSVPDGVGGKDISLIETREPATSQVVPGGRQGMAVTSFKQPLAFETHPSSKRDNVMYANVSGRRTPRQHENAH